MRRVLLTGFEPVSPATVNPAWDAVDLLARTWEGPGEVIARRLPAVFGEAPHRLRMSIAKHIPDAVVMTATAPGLPGVAVERIAINLDDATLPDNAGSMPVDQPIVEDGPAGLWSTLPDRAIVERLSSAGVPCGLSTSAGTYIGNHTFYQVQRELMNWGVPSGLLRLPASPALGLGPEVPTFSEEEMAAALRIVVLTVMAELGDDAAHILLAQETAASPAPADQAAPPAPPAPTPEPVLATPPMPEDAAASSAHALPASFDPEDEDVATQPFLMPVSEPIYQPDAAAEVPALEPEDSPSFTQVVFPDRATAAAATAAPEDPAPATAPLHVAPRVPSMDQPEPASAVAEAGEPAQGSEAESVPDTEGSAPPALTWDQIIGGRG